MTQKIGERELELRRQREAKFKPKTPAEVAATLPKTSGKKPVKRKAKRKAKKQPGVIKPKPGEPKFEV